MRIKVLVVEDEQNIAEQICQTLVRQDMNAIVAKNGQMAKTMVASHVPDVVLLDLGLPDMDGSEIVQYIREEIESEIPIIVVTARTAEKEIVRLLELGADGYITKPFGADELVARTRSAMRRARVNANAKIYQSGDLYVDMDHSEVRVAGKRISLTNNEFKILCCLIRDAGKPVTHASICKEIWGPYSKKDSSTLRVNMSNIRRKIEENPVEPKYIFADPGVGYVIAENQYKKQKPEATEERTHL